MTSDSDLATKVERALRRTGEGFEDGFPGSTAEFVGAIVPAFASLQATLERFDTLDREGASPTPHGGDRLVWSVLWDACNALLASFVLLQRGYATETLAVLRTVFERIACALVLHDNPDLIPRFRAGRLKDLGTKAVGPASDVLPSLGHWIGSLSELGAHVGIDNIGTGFVAVVRDDRGEEAELAVGGVVETTGPRAAGWKDMARALTSIAQELLAAAPEQVFFNERRKRAKFRTART